MFSEGKLTEASDVYSFSIVMYEMLTWRIPYEDEPNRAPQLVKILSSSKRPAIPPDGQLCGGAPPAMYRELMEVGMVLCLRRIASCKQICDHRNGCECCCCGGGALLLLVQGKQYCG